MRTIGVACVGMSPALVATVVEDGAVLLDLDSKYFYSLNKSGWAILQLAETAAVPRERIVEQCRAWGAADNTQIEAFLDELCSHGILEGAEDAAPLEAVKYEGAWVAPTVSRQAEPLQSVVTSAFDPSIPLAE